MFSIQSDCLPIQSDVTSNHPANLPSLLLLCMFISVSQHVCCLSEDPFSPTWSMRVVLTAQIHFWTMSSHTCISVQLPNMSLSGEHALYRSSESSEKKRPVAPCAEGRTETKQHETKRCMNYHCSVSPTFFFSSSGAELCVRCSMLMCACAMPMCAGVKRFKCDHWFQGPTDMVSYNCRTI